MEEHTCIAEGGIAFAGARARVWEWWMERGEAKKTSLEHPPLDLGWQRTEVGSYPMDTLSALGQGKNLCRGAFPCEGKLTVNEFRTEKTFEARRKSALVRAFERGDPM